jgi:hypothetical protein
MANFSVPMLEDIVTNLEMTKDKHRVSIYSCHDINIFGLLHVFGAEVINIKNEKGFFWPDYGKNN